MTRPAKALLAVVAAFLISGWILLERIAVSSHAAAWEALSQGDWRNAAWHSQLSVRVLVWAIIWRGSVVVALCALAFYLVPRWHRQLNQLPMTASARATRRTSKRLLFAILGIVALLVAADTLRAGWVFRSGRLAAERELRDGFTYLFDDRFLRSKPRLPTIIEWWSPEPDCLVVSDGMNDDGSQDSGVSLSSYLAAEPARVTDLSDRVNPSVPKTRRAILSCDSDQQIAYVVQLVEPPSFEAFYLWGFNRRVIAELTEHY